MRKTVYLFWLVGLGLFAAIISLEGWGQIVSLLKLSGLGIIWTALYHFIQLITFTLAWRSFLPPGLRLPFSTLFWARWISEAVNVLLPVAHVGGDLVRARLTAGLGLPGPVAGASVLVDVTWGLVTEVVFAMIGMAVLFQVRGTDSKSWALLVGLLIFALVQVGFFFIQRMGIFSKLGRIAVRVLGSRWQKLLGDSAAVDQALEEVYRRPLDVLIGSTWRLISWLLGTGEVWLAFYFLGHPVGLTEALILESLAQAMRSAAFFIPGGLGAQEGAFILFGTLLGLDRDLCLTVSLVKRAREVLFGVPGLLAWQIAEGRHLWKRGRAVHS